MTSLRPWLAVALVALGASAAGGSNAAAQQPSAEPPAAVDQQRPIDPANLDTTCAPCKDFYQFANGGWVARTPVPAAYPQWGSFNVLADRNNAVLRSILDAAAANTAAARGSNDQKLGAFYGTCMDSARIETGGAKPLAPILQEIAAVRTPADLMTEAARLHARGVGAFFAFAAAEDFKNTTQVIAHAFQGGLGLPDRDYYTRTDSSSVALRAKYEEHVSKMLELAGTPAAQARAGARRVLAIETALAQASMTRVQQRDPNAIYHKTTLAELKAMTPNVPWDRYFAAAGLSSLQSLNVGQPEFFKALDSLMKAVPATDWQTYLRWHVVREAAPSLGSAFVNENFRFNAQLTGAKELLPRWKRCLQATDAALGEALGQAYVEKTFGPEAKRRALEMVHNLEAALQDRLGRLAWMSDSTRRQALAKLAAFEDKIGYPDRWRDYSALDVDARSPYVVNVMRAAEFERARNLRKIGKPVDRGEWGMSPPTVNAYYNPLKNEIVFPAGILQPPFFDPKADDAVNYGGMGAVIGHEMTHGFDDQGRQFDARGNLRDWWTAADAEQYKARATRVSNQFDQYVSVDTLRLNGKLTLGENIADLGGLTIAYAALQKALEGKPRPTIDGFTPEQRFFLAWAQIWRNNTRPEYARMLVTVDPHSPGKWRVNGPLGNMPEFAKAFGCKAGDPMVRGDKQRAEIW